MTAKAADRPLAGHHMPEFAAEKRRRRSPRVSIHLAVSLVILALAAPAVGFLAHIVAKQNQERELEVSRRGEEFAGEIAASVAMRRPIQSCLIRPHSRSERRSRIGNGDLGVSLVERNPLDDDVDCLSVLKPQKPGVPGSQLS